MNVETVLNSIDTTLAQATGKHLSDLQTEILRGSWSGEKYEAIADLVYCTEGHVRDVAADLWQQLSTVLDTKIGKKNFKSVLEQKINLGELSSPAEEIVNQKRDWGDAPDISAFRGRTEELNCLTQWIREDDCRLISLLGMGGMGKTSLAAKLALYLEDDFELIIWRSLRNAPSSEDLVTELVKFLSQQQETTLSNSFDNIILRLLEYLRTSRCLLILDNLESILQGGVGTGSYRFGYEDYSQLIKAVGETQHQSCLILTSREKPQGLSILEGDTLPVRTLQLTGLSPHIGQAIFSTKGSFNASPEQWQFLIERYAGNPLALKIVASAISDWFGGDIVSFLNVLEQDSFIFEDLQILLAQQFQRLSSLEQEIMFWLAMNRQPVSISDLITDLISPVSPSKLLPAISSLQHRSLIEKNANGITQQSVVMEYLTNKAIEGIFQEIISAKINLFNKYAIVKAQAPDYVRDSQIRFILRPLIEKLIEFLGSSSELSSRLQQILNLIRQEDSLKPGYAGGNIINLLSQSKVDLTGYDFSDLAVWQANLQEVNLQEVNFTNSDLSRSIFSETLESVLSVALSPNGQLLATGDVNGYIRLWQMPTGTQLLILTGHKNWVRTVTFSPDSRTLVSGSYDQTVKLWDCLNGNCLRTYSGHEHGVSSVEFSPNGQVIASGSYDRTIKLWSVKDNECLQTFTAHQDWVNSVAFSIDGSTLASGSADCTVKLWDISNGVCLKTFDEHTDGVSSVAFSPDDQTLASGSADCTIKLWSLPSDRCLQTFTGHREWIDAIAFSADGRTLASGSGDCTVKLWDISKGVCFKTCLGHSNAVWSVAWHPQEPILVSGSFDQTVRFWHSRSGESLKTLAGHTNWIRSIAFSHDSNWVISGHTDNQLRIWHDLNQKSQILTGHQAQVCAVAISTDDKIIASASYDETIRLWDKNTGKSLNVLSGHDGWVCAISMSPDGRTLASGGFDRAIKLWDISSGSCLQSLAGHENVIWSVAFSPDGQTLASGSADHTIKLWDISSGSCLQSLAGHENVIWSVAFSPDGQTLASGGADRAIKLWDISSGSCLQSLVGHQNWVFSVVFSPDSQTLASGSHDHTVKLWDISGKCLQTYTAHTKEVYSVAFSPDGQTLASGSQDGTIKLWQIKTGECLATLQVAGLYQGMNITGVKGLTKAQKETLKAFGAKKL